MDLKKAVKLIKSSKNILVTTHTKPDGDACGCVAALTEVLRSLGKKTTPMLLTELPAWYAFLFDKKPAVFNKDISIKQLAQFDIIITLDVNCYAQMPEIADFLKKNKTPVLAIDHHLTDNAVGDAELVDTSAAAAGLIVLDLIKYAKWRITPKIARALFVAISTDTGWFRFTNTDSRTLNSCAYLMQLGVSADGIYHRLYQNFSLQRFRLMTAMLDTLQLHFDGRYATQYILRTDFKKTGSVYTDTENLINECQRIETIQAAALFVETDDGRIKCSLRSRDSIDVRKIAQKYDGGGHKMAAGLHLKGPLKAAMKTIAAEIKKQLKK